MRRLSRAGVASAADRLGVVRAALSVRRVRSPWIPVLTYHRVTSVGEGHLLDDGVVDATPAQFERQVGFVRRWFDPVGIDDLVGFAEGGRHLPRNPLMITFDDGYREGHDVAMPILARHGVRAVFFVTTDYVERHRPFWWDRVSFAIKSARRSTLALSYPQRYDLPLGSPAERRGAIAHVQRIIKDRAGLDVDRFVGEVEDAAGGVLSTAQARAMADATVMTWREVAALRRAGMDVQSHSHSHRVLDTLDAGDLERELAGSREQLEAVLGEPVRAISYPVGRSLPTGSPVRRAVRAAGYRLGFSNATGVNRRQALDPLDVRRISLDLAVGDAPFRAMLALPWLAPC